MKADIKTKWVAALRSGEYEQTRAVLRSNGGFCCLGVLCDLYSKETGIPWEPDYGLQFTMHGLSGVLPHEVRRWAELPHENGAFMAVSRRYGEDDDAAVWHSVSLTELNDNWMYDFHQIADVIEQQL